MSKPVKTCCVICVVFFMWKYYTGYSLFGLSHQIWNPVLGKTIFNLLFLTNLNRRLVSVVDPVFDDLVKTKLLTGTWYFSVCCWNVIWWGVEFW